MKNGKQLRWVGPNPRQAKAGGNGEAGKPFSRVLIRKLRNDFFAPRKMKVLTANMNRLFRLADQVHLDAPAALVVDCLMSPEWEIEVCVELAVRANKQIQIKFRRNAGAVVIGSFQKGAVLLEVDADDQPAVLPAEPANAPQKIRGDFRFQISNGRAGKINGDMIWFAARSWQLQRLEIIAAHRQNFERGHGTAQFRGRVREPLLGNIYWDIGDRTLEMFEQHSRLHACTGPEANQLSVGPD